MYKILYMARECYTNLGEQSSFDLFWNTNQGYLRKAMQNLLLESRKINGI